MPAGTDCPDAHTPAGWTALGASVQFVVTDPARLERGRAMLASELAAIDAACNGLRPDSELALLAGKPRHGAGPVRVGPLLAEAIAAALRTAQLTGGDIDPTVGEYSGPGRFPPEAASEPELAAFFKPDPGWRQVRLDVRARLLWLPPMTHLDLSATARAWAVDRCAGRLAGTLGCGVLVGLGGDIAVAGQVPAGGWRIRVQDVAVPYLPEPRPTATSSPQPRPKAVTIVAIYDGGLATSSRSARRWRVDPLHYILDPRGGIPAAPFWRTVSVAAATCTFASAASTAAMIRGRHAKEWLASLRLPARLVALDGRVHTVAGWPAAA
ncbi:MAG TPA: FAD:protein FMN transferase [Streptosporangiaceae bacterium]|nr:FAD:protein FMN transferase [Streptosporangiaceae bacterium]